MKVTVEKNTISLNSDFKYIFFGKTNAVFDFQQVKLELINRGLLSLVATSWVGNGQFCIEVTPPWN